MLTLHDAIIGYAHATLVAHRTFPLCKVDLSIVPIEKRFVFATFVTAWRTWMSTPITPSTVN
jgi:hypothetical protein